MKNLLLLIVLIISVFAISSANAQSRNGQRCRAELMDRQNYVLQTFIGQGYYRQDACNDARFQCGCGQKIEGSALPEPEALIDVSSGVSLHFRLGRAEPMIVGYDLRKTAAMVINQ